MKVSKEWLNELIEINVSTEELAEKITRSGIEVDDIHDYTSEVRHLVVGYVESIKKHPEADKLNICQVNLGEETKQIVCGAPNVDAGQYVIVSKVGGRLPGGIKIKRAKLRGEVSEGMICALEEIGVPNDLVPQEYQEGIYIFNQKVTPGEDALQALKLDDQVIEFDLTANRKDALSMIGFAHETRALFGGTVKQPESNVQQIDAPTVTIKNENHAIVPYYSAIEVKNVKVCPSPLWIQSRLIKYGIRPINNIVDISNYVMLELGQPLHMFDRDTIGSDEIFTRLAHVDETITTLDGKERQLTTDDIVITNGEKPIALAGVMGGDFSEVSNSTTRVLIESAVFEPTHVRKTSSRLKLRSEASSRFEKGVSHEFVDVALKRAAYLLERYAGGTVSKTAFDGELNTHPKTIETSISFINNRLGTTFDRDAIENTLNKLGLKVSGSEDNLTVTIPSRRDDLLIPEDITEEVARIYGYDNLKSTLPVYSKITPGKLTDVQKKTRIVKRQLESMGLNQAINYALTSEERSKEFTSRTNALKLLSPMSADHAVLRNSLIPHLVDNVVHNSNRQRKNVALYEIGKVFMSNTQNRLPSELNYISGILTGELNATEWLKKSELVDFYTAKGVVESIFNKLGLFSQVTYEAENRYKELHPGRTARVLLNNEDVGFVAELHPEYAKKYDLNRVAVFELNLESILNTHTGAIQYEQLSKFPSVSRDLALVVSTNVSSQTLVNIIYENATDELVDVYPFDVYDGEHMEEGKKSVAIRLTYLNREQTLTEADIERVHQPIVEALKNNGALIRE